MTLDPILAAMLANTPEPPTEIDDFPALRAQDSAARNATIDQLTEPAPEGAERRVTFIPVQGGTIELHMFTPVTPGPHPAHLYLHGGGWVNGSINDQHINILCTERAVWADCVVVTAEYRLAPEHKFPIGLGDCYAALLWIANNADDLGIRPDLITIGGESAGANLAAAVALRARDENGPALALQLLDVPGVDLTATLPSQQRNATGYGLTEAALQALVSYYLASPEDAYHPYASPLLAKDLSGLPPAYILSAEYDPLCDHGKAYADKLNHAGVPATYSLQLGQIHGSSFLTKILPAARAWRDEAIGALQRAHQSAHRLPTV